MAEVDEILGYCKECGTAVTKKDEMLPDYKGCFECSNCYYPSKRKTYGIQFQTI